jgi:hypothetical protein
MIRFKDTLVLIIKIVSLAIWKKVYLFIFSALIYKVLPRGYFAIQILEIIWT